MPVQETARDAATRGTPTSERDLVRMKRLQKMSISDDPSFQPSSSPSGPRRSASSPSNSQTATELAKNSETSPIKAGVSSSFEVGQLVKVDHKPKPWYGVIYYIGPVNTDCPGTFAGVEMDEVVEGGHSGKFLGKRYFTCDDGHGLMLPLSRLKLDDRFDPPSLKGGSTNAGGDDVERDKHMPSTPTQPTASRKPSDPPSPDLMKGAAAKPTQKEMPGVFESTDSPETGDGGEIGCLAFECPGDVAGFVIGRDGKNRRVVESKTDTKIRVEKKEVTRQPNTRVVIIGEKENCKKALFLIVQNLRRKTALHIATTETIDIPSQHCGRVIGRKGGKC
ncbi:Ubiquitin carboxyl-terminal hydrolase CYLD [Geodia barretti]|nr:Ubiquitin carboxyl-terminal hydrolase CYLD [Geodia barretti]